MKIKTANLSGIALDWAVAKCESRLFSPYASSKHHFAPSNRWSQGGLIIEREGIETTRCNDLYFPKGNENGDYCEPYWKAKLRNFTEYGKTPLIAAMRVYAKSKFGDTIEITEEDLL